MKLVINPCFGGFGLSEKAFEWLNDRSLSIRQIKSLEEPRNRANNLLVECVETLGIESNGLCSNLKVIECEEQPYYISEHDGCEELVLSSSFVIPKYKFD